MSGSTISDLAPQILKYRKYAKHSENLTPSSSRHIFSYRSKKTVGTFLMKTGLHLSYAPAGLSSDEKSKMVTPASVVSDDTAQPVHSHSFIRACSFHLQNIFDTVDTFPLDCYITAAAK